MLVDAVPPIEENGAISEKQLMTEIHRRFAPGENCIEAEIMLETHIHQSTTRTFTYSLVDKLHDNGKVLAAIGQSAQRGLSSLWNVAGLGSASDTASKSNGK